MYYGTLCSNCPEGIYAGWVLACFEPEWPDLQLASGMI